MNQSSNTSRISGSVPHGTGTPYLAIFNGNKKPIIDETMGVTIGELVTDFEYEYAEKDEDNATVTVETSNVNLDMHPDLQYLKEIHLQWGWIHPDGTSESSPVRKLMVRDHKIEYTSDGIKIVLELVNSTYLLKTSPASYNKANTPSGFEGYLSGILNGKGVTVKVVDFRPKNTMVGTKLILKEHLRQSGIPEIDPSAPDIELPEEPEEETPETPEEGE